MVELARWARYRRGPGTRSRGARPGNAAAVGPGVSAGRALVRQGPRPDSCRHAGDRGATSQSRTRWHGGSCRTHRARMASDGPQGRGARGCAAARMPRTARVSNRRRYGHDSRAADARGRRRPRAGAQCGPRSSVQQGRQQTFDSPGNISAETPTLAQQQAAALALLAESALHHGIDPDTPSERYQVVVHVDAPALADPDASGQSALEDGTHVSAETSRRLACDASRVVMQHRARRSRGGSGDPTRTIPPALRRALHHRDRRCRFPGCTV